MRDFLEVFKHTFSENIRKKSFIVSTVVILIIIVGAMVVPAIITNSRNNDAAVSTSGSNPQNVDQKPKAVLYILDESKLYDNKLEALQQQFPQYQVKPLEEGAAEKVKEAIRKEGKDYLIVVREDNNILKLDYFTQQYMEGPNPDTINKVFKNINAEKLLKAANVPQDTIEKALGELTVNVNALGKSKLGGYISSIVIVMILFFAVYFYGYGVSMSVASEKTSRVMEILVTSVKPSRIILGKTAGMGLLGLLQLAILIGVGAVTYKLVFPDKFTIEGMPIEFSGFTPMAVVLIIVYFVLGYTLYALMNAVVGATVSKAEDVQSAMMPMSFLAIIAFYFSYGTFAIPDSTIARVASLIPFCSPFSVPSRLMSTDVPLWEIGLSLVILIGTILLIGTLSIKLYSYAVLHYGDRLKISKLFEMSKAEKTGA